MVWSQLVLVVEPFQLSLGWTGTWHGCRGREQVLVWKHTYKSDLLLDLWNDEASFMMKMFSSMKQRELKNGENVWFLFRQCSLWRGENYVAELSVFAFVQIQLKKSCLFVWLVGFLTSSYVTEQGGHDFCLSRSHHTNLTTRELAVTPGFEHTTSLSRVTRSTNWATIRTQKKKWNKALKCDFFFFFFFLLIRKQQ